jgi:hypothetical protein
MRVTGLLVLLAIVFASSCSAFEQTPVPAASDRPPLGVSNGTTLTVSVFVNGRQVATFAPGGPVPTIDVGALPPLPWMVEARSPSGRVLTTMEVTPGTVLATTYPDGDVETTGTVGRVDLSCGSLRIWAGFSQPSGPAPMPSSGTPGDCLP